MLAQLVLAQLGLVLAVVLALPYFLYFIYIRRYARQTPLKTCAFHIARVTIVICTLNAAEHIEKKLYEILHQKYPLEDLEVIVVDGGSTDGTVEILRQMRDELRPLLSVTVIEDGTLKGKASQINQGIRVSKGEIVVTTDADAGIDEAAIQALVASLSVSGVGAVCARQLLTNPHQNLVTETEATYRGFYEMFRIGESNLHSTPIFHGGLSGYRREAVSSIAEDVNADDTQLALAAIRRGFRAVYEPRVVFYTNSPTGLSDSMHQRIRRGQGLQRIFWRNRDMIPRRKFGALSFPILLMELYIHLISPLLFGVSAVCLAGALVLALSPFLVIALPVGLGLAVFLYWGRKSFPIRFLASFALYQLALLCAIALHLLGYNYKHWSRKTSN